MKYSIQQLLVSVSVAFLGAFALALITLGNSTVPAKPIIDKAAIHHHCADQTHLTCDGKCVCDGFECDLDRDLHFEEWRKGIENAKPTNRLLREYQLDIQNNWITIYDCDRIVGVIPFDYKTRLAKALMADND